MSDHVWLVVDHGWPTPLKNMTSSVGMMTFPIYEKMAMSQFLLIPCLVGWTSIYQLYQGYKVLTHCHMKKWKMFQTTNQMLWVGYPLVPTPPLSAQQRCIQRRGRAGPKGSQLLLTPTHFKGGGIFYFSGGTFEGHKQKSFEGLLGQHLPGKVHRNAPQNKHAVSLCSVEMCIYIYVCVYV